MKSTVLRCMLLLTVCGTMVMAGCAGGAPPPPTAERPLPAGPCGDGVCDEVERARPQLCPQDCPPPEEAKAAEPSPTEPPPTVAPPVTVESTPAPPTPTSAPPTATTAPTPTPEPPSTATPETAGAQMIVLASGEIARVGDPGWLTQEGGGAGETETRQANAAFILDASGSMNAALPGTGKTKLQVAKEVMAQLVPEIPSEVHGALWIYGHRYPQDPKDKSCTDIERVFALGPVDAAAYVQRVNAAKAIGYTPISDSIEQAAADLPAGDFNSIILVSDGEETCGGDPCALAEALKASDAHVTIHVVGYAVEEVAQKQLQCIAQASGGTYHDAQDAQGLLQAVEEAMAATVVETTLRVDVISPDGEPVGTAIGLYEAGTDRLVSDLSSGKENAVPPGGYDLVIETLPRILYQELSLPEGSATVVRVGLGGIRVLTPDGKEDTFSYLYDDAGNRIDFKYAGLFLVPPGTYRVDSRKSMSDPIALQAGELVELRLGSIHVTTPDGREDTMVYIYDDEGQQLDFGYAGTILLVPGTYRLGVRNHMSEPIALGAGEALELKLGSIHVTTPDGREDTTVYLYDDTDQRLDFGRAGTIPLLPAHYYLIVNDTRSQPILVKSGETTEFRLGVIQAPGSFELYDGDGNRLGGFRKNSALVVPGTYRVVLADGSEQDGVVVKAGEVTVVK
jgi:hypothetical protein